MAATVTYIEQLYDGNNFQTCTPAEFLTRLEKKQPTYEVTNDKENKVYVDFDYRLPTGQPTLNLHHAPCSKTSL